MSRPPLLLFLAPADDPARDAACATLAWIAAGEGSLFECYYSARTEGGHYGGGHPSMTPPEQLRGGTFAGGHHAEQLLFLVRAFECEAVCLGPGIFDPLLADLKIPVRARATNLEQLYARMLETTTVKQQGSLLIGDGGRPQGVSLSVYAFPEVVNRRLLAFPESDHEAAGAFGLPIEGLWLSGQPAPGVNVIESPAESSLALQTAWMARRWCDGNQGFLLADPEVASRWTPAAVRKRWLPVFAIPQRDIVRHLDLRAGEEAVVYGRQQDDRDFLELSRAGLAFQLVDPGRPAFPVMSEIQPRHPVAIGRDADPTDDQLRLWAAEGRVLTSLLFWTGMLRELENLYALADVISLARLSAGLVLTTASFEYMASSPLALQWVDESLGGLGGKVETLLASGGSGAFLESAVRPERFRETLHRSVDNLRSRIGSENLPHGWWAVMDGPLVPHAPPKLSFKPEAPYVSLRYRGDGGPASSSASGAEHSARRTLVKRLKRSIRRSALGGAFEPLRPFDAFTPAPPRRELLTAVRDAGFDYALTKAGFGGRSKVVTGVDGLTVLNYTAGRWDGWTPFVTINTIGDLRSAERRLLRQGPGWLVGTLDTCLWAFSGTVLDRGRPLLEICKWVAGGGSSGRLVNVRPQIIARYAAILAKSGAVEKLVAG
jgi:hypothetical protein